MNDDLLVTWKDIAAYLKCSVRKAQRLERQQLPVKRLPNTKAVWASKAEIDQWLSRQSAQVATDPFDACAKAQFRFPGQLWMLALFFALTSMAALSSAYALTIVLFVIEAALLVVTYPRLPDRVYTRAFVATFLIAGLSYAIAATSLPAVLSGTVNMTTLPPAFAYPFVAGLRFIPVPIVISVMLIFGRFGSIGGFDRSRHIRIAYVVGGAILIGAAAVFGFVGLQRIWRPDFAIRWTLMAGELFICAVNGGLLALGYSFFRSPRGGYAFVSKCGVACVLIALTAAINSRHWAEITHSYLDVLSPGTYKVRNPDAAADFGKWTEIHGAEAGSDLVALSRDPEFLHALQNNAFYKQDFDEGLQVSRRALIFGFRDAPTSTLRRPEFQLIRFPADLVAMLQFEPVHRLNRER